MASYNSSSHIDPLNDGEFNPKDEPKLEVPEVLKEQNLNAYKDAMAKKELESAGLRPCPHCGYCPTCGRPQNVPYYPPIPYNPWYSVTWCSGTVWVNTSV